VTRKLIAATAIAFVLLGLTARADAGVSYAESIAEAKFSKVGLRGLFEFNSLFDDWGDAVQRHLSACTRNPFDGWTCDPSDCTICSSAQTPLPAALPLYGTGLGVMGYLGWRRKRKAAVKSGQIS
jgi:hypothetical protein